MWSTWSAKYLLDEAVNFYFATRLVFMMSYDKYFPSEYAISLLTYILIALLKNYIRASFENFNPNFNFSHLGIFSLKPFKI